MHSNDFIKEIVKRNNPFEQYFHRKEIIQYAKELKIPMIEAKTNPKKQIYEDCVGYAYDYKSFLFFQFENGFYTAGVKRNRQGTVNSDWFKPLNGIYKEKVKKYLKKEELKRKEIIDLFGL